MRHIFCVIGETNSGKNTILNEILDDEEFIKSVNIRKLVYGTTRPKRPGEKEAEDYYFMSKKEFLDFHHTYPDKLVEYRGYNSVWGRVYYFTKEKYISDLAGKNIICTCVPMQYKLYTDWIKRMNKQYKVHIIYLNTSLYNTVKRGLNRANDDKDVFDLCRRIVEDKEQYDKVFNSYDSNKLLSMITIYNEDDKEIYNHNIKRIKQFISDKILEEDFN